MNKVYLTILMVIIIVGLLFYIIIGSINKKNQTILYYCNTCPHCAAVRDWMDKQHIDKKITIIQKEVYLNPVNKLEMEQAARKCKISDREIGVPFFYSDGKCYIGTPDVIAQIANKAGVPTK